MISIKSHVLSTHKLPHQRGRDGGRLVHSHRQMKLFVTDGREGEGSGVVQPSVYQGTHNQGNPFGRYRRMLGGRGDSKRRCSVSICTRKPMHLRTSPMIVIWFGLYKRIETVNNLSSSYYHHAHRAYTTPLKVCCFKVNRCKVLHSFILNG